MSRSLARMITWLVLLSASMLAGCIRDEALSLDAAERQRLGGSYIALPDGVTHYVKEDLGSLDRVVLIHGYSAPSTIWEPIIEQLHAAGLSTLRYDLFGHGFSDRPSTTYDRELYSRQLESLIERLTPNARLHLVGWSMGAMIAARYAVDHPDRVASVSLFSPSGLPIRMGVLGRAALFPVVGEVGYALIGGAAMRNAQAEFFEDEARLKAYRDDYDRQLAYRGYRSAMLSTLRSMNMDDFAGGYRELGSTALPVEAYWAVKDRATPFVNHTTFQQLVPQAVVVALEGVGHASFFERPLELSPRLIQHIRQHTRKAP